MALRFSVSDQNVPLSRFEWGVSSGAMHFVNDEVMVVDERKLLRGWKREAEEHGKVVCVVG